MEASTVEHGLEEWRRGSHHFPYDRTRTSKLSRIWTDQCDAARGIKARFGAQKALGYLVGEKLLNFVRAAEDREDFAKELPRFAEEVKTIIESEEIREYLDTATCARRCPRAAAAVLPLRAREIEFLRRPNDRGEIAPDLLTSDEPMQRLLRAPPGLRWKALNVRHRGLGVDHETAEQ